MIYSRLFIIGLVSVGSILSIHFRGDITLFDVQSKVNFENSYAHFILLLALTMHRSLKVFLVCVALWEIAVGLLYGFLLGYTQSSFTAMNTGTTDNYYYATDSGTVGTFKVNSTQSPFPQIVIAIAIILLIVGLAMIAGYYERASVSSMAFTLLIFALTIQNFFIFRDFWDRISVNDPNASAYFSNDRYNKLNLINYDNIFQPTSVSTITYTFTSSSFLDMVGASLALYAGFTAVIGRIGFGEIFFLSWIGTFFYELNSQILWRLFIPDNGFASRAFAFGGMLGLISSFILGKKELTKDNENVVNRYQLRTLALLGVIFVWCCFPILTLVNTYNTTNGQIVAMPGQVNIWLALAASALGSYGASMYMHAKFCVHDLVFSAFTGAIAYSSSTDINYNPGAALAIGSSVGFICCICQSKLKTNMNSQGIIDTNGTTFQFLLPSFFAAVFSAILSAVNQSGTTFTPPSGTPITYNSLREVSRSAVVQGGYQMAGWLISIGIGGFTGLVLGIIYKLLDERNVSTEFFSDHYFYSKARLDYDVQQDREKPKAAVK